MQISLNDESCDYTYKNLGAKVYPEQKDNPPEWGCLIHPDEMRRVLFVGNSKLITTTGDQLEDYHLKNWIDLSIVSFGNQMQWDIYPRLWRNPRNQDGTERYNEVEEFAEFDDGYDYKPTEADYFLVKLRNKPISRLHEFALYLPLSAQRFVDLKQRASILHKHSMVRAMFIAMPYGYGGNTGSIGLNSWRAFISSAGNILPQAYRIEYTSGYTHSRLVPAELKEILMDYITINVMSAYGDGIVGGMSNYSTSVGILSESVGTTMSATSAYYGARIEQLGKKIQNWWKARQGAYGKIIFSSL